MISIAPHLPQLLHTLRDMWLWHGYLTLRRATQSHCDSACLTSLLVMACF